MNIQINKQYYNDLSKYDALTKQEIKDLYLEIKKGNQNAKNQLIQSNLKLVIYFAKMFKSLIPKNSAIELDDVISEGNVGLMKAVDKFNPDFDIKFSYYASYWIKKTITEFIMNESQSIKSPLGKKLSDNKIQNVVNELFQQKQSEIHQEDIEQLNIFTSYEISHYFIDKPNVSPIVDDSLFADDATVDIVKELDDAIIKKHIKYLLEVLTTNEIKVIKMYYGIDINETYSLRETATKLKISHTRVKQIRDSALSKLKGRLTNSLT